MLRKAAFCLLLLGLFFSLLSCGPSEEELMLAQFQTDLEIANSVIDSLNYTVESTNQLIDEMRVQVDSTQRVNDRLVAEMQKLNREMRQWQKLAKDYKENKEKLTAEIERMKVEKQADRQAIAQLRSQADSLSSELLDAHTSIRRQSDNIRGMEVDLAKAQDEVDELRNAKSSVNLYIATEQFLKENGYLETSRPFGGAFRKNFKLIKKLDPTDPAVRLVPIGESVVLGGSLSSLVDRFGKLKKGDDFQLQNEEGQEIVTFVNEMLGGVDVLAVIKE